MTPPNIIILQDSSTASSLREKLSGLTGFEFLFRTPNDSTLDDLRREKISLMLIEWSGSSSEMRDFVRDVEKVRSFVPRIAILTSSANTETVDPILHGMDGVLRSPVPAHLLHFLIEQHAKPALERWSRKEPRKTVELPIEIFNATKTLQVTAMVKNVSSGGMFVELTSPSPLLKRDEEIFFLGDGKSEITGSGVVRWVQTDDSFGMGVQFIEVNGLSSMTN